MSRYHSNYGKTEAGEGTGGGKTLKIAVDEDYVVSLEDDEIGKYALKALRKKLLGDVQTGQKVIDESELEEYLAKGWRYVDSPSQHQLLPLQRLHKITPFPLHIFNLWVVPGKH